MSKILKSHFNHMLNLLPNFMWPVKVFILKRSFKNIGNGVKLSANSFFAHPSNTIIRDNVFINSNFYCSTLGILEIKDRVMFGANCSIIGGDHKYDDPLVNMRFNKILGDNKNITIEEDAWIGHGSTILKNSRIREGVILGANSLINADTLPYSVYVGQPAKFIKPRFKTLNDLTRYLEMMRLEYGFATSYDEEYLNKIYLKDE